MPVLNHFDDFYATRTSNRADVCLYPAGKQDSTPFPKEECLQVLRVTTLLLDNCSNKHIYTSTEVGRLHPRHTCASHMLPSCVA